MANVLVLDGWTFHSLAVIRSLARAGHRVHIAEAVPAATAFYSRDAHRSAVYPSPLSDTASFHEWLDRYVRRQGIDVVLPLSEATTGALAWSNPPCASLLPSPAAFTVFSNKWRTLALAASLGVPAPRSLQAAGDIHLATAQAAEVGFPLVVKARESSGGSGMELVESPAAFGPALRRVRAVDPEPVLQEWIGRGRQFDVCLLYGPDGELAASFMQEELRHYPVHFGISVLQESIAPLPDMLGDTLRLLAATGWRGPVEAEFRLDAAGHYRLMEVNPRFWGSLALSVFAGVDFPRLLVELALGRQVEPVTEYRLGLRNRYLMGDLRHWLRPHPKMEPSFLRTYDGRTRDNLFEWRDPLPALVWAGRSAFEPARKLLNKARPEPATHGLPAPAVQGAHGGTPGA